MKTTSLAWRHFGQRQPAGQLAGPRRTGAAFALVVSLAILFLPCALAGQTESQVQGTVKEVLPQRGVDGNGTHILVRTRSGLLEACLGPTQFLESNHASPQAGDVVVIKGHPVTSANGQLFLASQLAGAGRSLILRDAAGKPRWAGCGHDCGRAGNCEQHPGGRHGHDGH